MLDLLRGLDKRCLIKKNGQASGEILRTACNVTIELISPA
jgi:hypothetical protein